MTLLDRIGRAPIAAAQLGVFAFAAMEVAWSVGPAAVGWLAIARALLLAAALAAPTGVVVGLVLAVAIDAFPHAARRPPIGVVLGLPIAALVWIAGHSGALLFAAFRLNNPSLSASVVALIAVMLVPIAALPIFALARWMAPIDRRFPGAGQIAAGGGCVAGAALVLWSPPLAFISLATAVALAIRGVGARVSARASLVAAAVGFVVALSPLCDDEIVFRAQRDSVLVPTTARALSLVLDWDRDGALAVLGGGDCDEGDASVGPLAIEVAGDGVDQDCRFGDLEPRREDHAARHPRVRQVLLVSVSGLDIDARGQLSPPMPGLQARIDSGVRFAGAVGVGGRFRDVAPVLTDGALPPSFVGDHSGFSTAAGSIPSLLERAAGSAFFVAEKKVIADLATQFVGARTKAVKGPTDALAATLAGLGSPGSSFTWLHVRLGAASKRAALDAALAQLVGRLDRDHRGAMAIIVGLHAGDGRGAAIAGGPLAIVGTAVTPSVETRAVGLFDVYPTVVALLGLSPLAPAVGDSLLAAPDRIGAITGAVSAASVRLGATDGRDWVLHDPDRRRFESSRGDFSESASPPEVGALASLVRTAVLGPRLARANLARSRSIATALPVVVDGTPMVVARALTVHGCTARQVGDRRLEVSVYMSGGERLRADDLLIFKLSSAHRGSTRGRLVPGAGSRPFGTWRRGELVAEHLELDTRRLRLGTATLWVGVDRGGVALPITSGSGATPTWGRVCAVEVK